jgi:hypothetical protein
MAKVVVQHHVASYESWLPVFTEHETVRRQHGATRHTVSRSVSDPNDLVVVTEFATLAGAQSFSRDPSLPEVMGRAGVDSAPQVWIVDEAESKAY